jgi:glycerol-3-phosphate dehydrogenase
VFILPYLGKTLIGITEVCQALGEDIMSRFSSIWAIFSSRNSNLSMADRESAISANNKPITIFGGKWTSAPSLYNNVMFTLEGLF